LTGINTYEGKLTEEAVADSWNMDYTKFSALDKATE
jgi:Alanine dehydrogenase